MKKSGMTLIEVVLSISLLALVMALAWGSYLTAIRTHEFVQSENEKMHGLEQAMQRMVRELSMAFIVPTEDEEKQFDLRYKTGFWGEDDRVDFTSLAHVRMYRNAKESDQMEVSYYVKNIRKRDGTYTRALVRREDAPIDDDPQRGGIVLIMLEDVKSFKLKYWDDAKAELAAGSNGWVDEWDTEKEEFKNRLPSRVKIEVEIEDPQRSSGSITFVTQTEIHLTEAIQF